MNKYQKWMMWGLLLPTYFISFFHRTSLSAIGGTLVEQLHISGAVGTLLGTLTGIYFFTYALMQLPIGFFADSIGPKRLVSFGSFVMGLATIAFAFSNNIMSAYIARFFIGLGASFNFICLLRIQTNWFEKKEFPLLTGIIVFVGNTGAMFGVGPFALIVDKIGIQVSYLGLGVISLIFGLLITLFVKDHPVKMVYKKDDNFSVFLTLKEVFSVKSNYYAALAFGFSSASYLAFAGFCGIPFLMHTYSLSRNDASGMITILTFGVLIGSLLNGALVKLFKYPKRAGVTLFFIIAVLWLLMIVIKFPAELLWIYNLIFFILGFSFSGFNLLFSNIRANNSEQNIGVASSFINFISFLMITTLQPFTGYVLDLFVDIKPQNSIPVYPYSAYRVVLLILLTVHLAALIGYLLVRRESLE